MAKLKLNNGQIHKLKFRKNEGGSVAVYIPNAHRGYLITFGTNGKIGKHPCINEELGLKLNKNGEIKTNK
jgi:hypothetical protein